MSYKSIIKIFLLLAMIFITVHSAFAGYVSTYSNTYVTDGYGSSNPVEYKSTYVRSDYKSKGDGYHAYYSDDGSERYVRNGYGTSTRNYKLYKNDYVYDGYGDSSSNNAGISSTHYIRDGYGSSNDNKAGIRGYTYTDDGYGQSSGKSDLSSMHYVKVCYSEGCLYDKPYYFEKKIRNGKYYLYHYSPVGTQYSDRDNYEYKVDVYVVRDNSYAYDDYPFN